MKKPILYLLLCFSITLTAQITNNGTPKSWNSNKASSIKAIKMPAFDLQQLQEEDAINDKKGDAPWRFGKEFMVNYTLNNSGKWTTLDNGDRIWRIRFESKGAKTLNFLFEDFYLPENATIYLYSHDRQDLLGAYTHTENNPDRILGSWLVSGDDVWIEYYEPSNVIGEGALKIGRLIHGYRSQSDLAIEKALNDSGNCNHDVDCPIDSSLEDLKNHNKKGVVLLLVGNSSFCSGSLINNTSNNGVPYILTANHCYSNPANWSFRFNWISPNPVCGTTANSTNGPTNQVMSGATLRARRSNSDFCLVEINNAIPSSWDVVWNGWNRTTTPASKSFGLHHPSGDIMKVCVDNNSPSSFDNNGNYWRINNWELGITEGGSSGSPLFDQEGRITGQLWRGSAACSGTSGNGGYDDYGRFNTSWDAGGTSSTQLKNWLDPQNTGATTLDPYPSMQTYELDASVRISDVTELVCGNSIFPVLEIKNNGTNNLTSATVNYQISGGNIATINWTGNLVQGASNMISLGEIQVSASGSFTATLINPNGQTDQNSTNNQASAQFEIVSQHHQTNQLIFVLQRDQWASETTWDFKNSEGTVLYSGGPYPNQQNPELITLTFDLSEEDCYTFTINDDFGDGICCTYGNGYYRLELPDQTIINQNSNFGDLATYTFSNINTMSVDTVNLDSKIRIYPNPSNGIVNINNNSGELLNYEVFNILGQKVLQGNFETTEFKLNLNSASGVYLIKFTNKFSNETSIKKVIVK